MATVWLWYYSYFCFCCLINELHHEFLLRSSKSYKIISSDKEISSRFEVFYADGANSHVGVAPLSLELHWSIM